MAMQISKRNLMTKAPAAGLLMAAATGHEAAAQSDSPLRIVGLEEHFMFPEFLGYLGETKQNINPALFDMAVPILSDFGQGRLDVMDKNGVDFVVLSLSGPGVQIEPDIAKATKLARLCNDRLAQEIQKQPTRYGGFAHLALQDPTGAADELERCVRQLGFKGALINGETNGVYLDDRRYDVFWERVQAIGAPIYIHPGNPPDKSHMYEGHPEMWGPVWSWAVETCSHAMRLIFSGVFDRYPGAIVILGHMGETLPIQLSRLDSRLPTANLRFHIKKKPSEYVRQNIRITTSGVFSDSALRCSLDAIGPEAVMFSIDYPFEKTEDATGWIKTAKISEAERVAVASGNATTILKL
ncbi:amidohydrolase [Acidisoma cellulosilytica]|uniref:Amidohydrolase n=1 Tax=Acidisoma cellulosilyticum TaxID=2802395 RepID=A0A963YZL3_9PROT|nr:amidohydrolase family protein [Acidisoma cellulosilyticum]MCB8879970.1 amidohydrolase [Acidisoma cellulosilyticum]